MNNKTYQVDTVVHALVMHAILSWVRPDDVKSGIDRTAVEGLAYMPYAFGPQRIEHLMQNTHVPVGCWRSVDGSQNAFAIESFVDELAHATLCPRLRRTWR